MWISDLANRVQQRVSRTQRGMAVFETGYGPSGLPHIGTFAEVARTSWVRKAFQDLTGQPTRLIAFSDDMDALRRVPDNVPRRDMLEQHLGLPLSSVPDPFSEVRVCPRCGPHRAAMKELGYGQWCSNCGGTGTVTEWPSFAAHNNARLRAFLDEFGFEHEFLSSTDCYRNGLFDSALLRMMECHDEIRDIILPTLGADRRATYSPFMPIHPITGHVMQVAIDEVRVQDGTLVWRDPEGKVFVTPVTGGHCKAQWKADWALRWHAFGVDFEMSGKDLIDSVKLSSKICKVLGSEPPVSFTYELFLDAEGHKISKSRGNGLSVEDWLTYGPHESLSHFLFANPERARRLHVDSIPRVVDDYLAAVAANRLSPSMDHSAWHIHGGQQPPWPDPGIGFSTLINLASVTRAETGEALRRFIRGQPDDPMTVRLAQHAVEFAGSQGVSVPRGPTQMERAAFRDLADALAQLPDDATADAAQGVAYEVGKRHPFSSLREWFKAIYQVLLGRDEGPRFGAFVGAYGVTATVALIQSRLDEP